MKKKYTYDIYFHVYVFIYMCIHTRARVCVCVCVIVCKLNKNVKKKFYLFVLTIRTIHRLNFEGKLYCIQVTEGILKAPVQFRSGDQTSNMH